MKKIFKKKPKKFVDSEKVTTFAVPFDENGIFFAKKVH